MEVMVTTPMTDLDAPLQVVLRGQLPPNVELYVDSNGKCIFIEGRTASIYLITKMGYGYVLKQELHFDAVLLFAADREVALRRMYNKVMDWKKAVEAATDPGSA